MTKVHHHVAFVLTVTLAVLTRCVLMFPIFIWLTQYDTMPGSSPRSAVDMTGRKTEAPDEDCGKLSSKISGVPPRGMQMFVCKVL